ncbi:SRPBCC family protein [Hymenobacter sp. BT491]|uniref:SRPBCC family protein n=1 Tax=Hymenobacter sp. BT491 TaxID=2766779 RepID=UPI0016538C1C|nr:hypothetical protein [Hymenobacter sp. BT491]MBC6991835.1 hypothetical protein [Hymenobacter sp. BT491]
MHLQLRTPVYQQPLQVFMGFTRDLFLRLAPPFPTMRLLRFDGCTPGDRVEIELLVGPARFRWTSLITEAGQLPDGSMYFIDEGQELPRPLRYWRHRHLIEHNPVRSGSIIVDDITYRTSSRLLDLLIYPLMWAQFAYRKPIYRRTFARL